MGIHSTIWVALDEKTKHKEEREKRRKKKREEDLIKGLWALGLGRP
jgi:hypothetical protein